MRSVSLRWWEWLLLALPVGVALLFLLAREWVAGLVLVAVVVVAAASRAEIVERNVAGGYARTRAVLMFTTAGALLVLYFVALGLLLYGRYFDEWNDHTPGRVAMYALAGLGIYLFLHIRRLGDEAENWLRGGDFEAEVAGELDRLREQGWTVTHDLKRDDGGNVDHLAKGPNGTYVIEAKSGRHRATDRGQALSNAVWVKQKFGEPGWVEAVLCVSQEPPSQPQQILHGRSKLWITGAEQLRSWLESRG